MRARPWILPALASLLAACGATGDGSIGDTEAATTDGDTTAATDTAVDTDTAGSTGTDTADTEVDTDTATTDTSSVAEATLVRGEFTIPAGAVVDAFVFSAEGEPPPFSTVGADVIVRVLDLTHPERDQTSLCSGNHPLNGCATVDYGAFGDTYDNHLIVAGEGGPIALHLFKDRTIQFGPEPLPPDE
ncbi:MAG: hypothetical protein KC636_21115 [Myxococcales bacterium]|nr:hypothetical protein [Myxococcales bacterium]